MRIATIVGNRPQFVKAAAVSRPLRATHEEILIHTGQHYDEELSRVFFDELDIPTPDIHLGLGSGTNIEQTARMMTALEVELERLAPDAALVYGDTNTTLAAAVTAAHLRLPLIHVEAGMRSFDRTMPEEVNRVLTDRVSGLCLCSTPLAIANLEREGLGGAATLVGDVMADIALRFSEIAEERSTILEERELATGGFALVTAHRAGNVDDSARLALLVELLTALPIAVFYPVHPRTQKRLKETGLLAVLAAAPNVTLSVPLGYLDLLKLVAHAGVVITDSGGLQKEAYVLGTKCITLRETTEWRETVDAGWNTLVGLSTGAALAALEHEPPQTRPDLYRAGRAAAGIVEAIGGWTPRLVTTNAPRGAARGSAS